MVFARNLARHRFALMVHEDVSAASEDGVATTGSMRRGGLARSLINLAKARWKKLKTAVLGIRRLGIYSLT